MAELNDKAKKVFALKYSTGKTKTWKETCRKIADFIAEAERNFGATDEQIKKVADKYYEFLYELYMLPGGRIIANAGTGIKNLANCFVLGMDDSRRSIYQTLKDAAEIFAMGGGVGYNFSHIREEGADIKTTGGKASGPLSFMSLFDQTGEVIQQASRRGAQLGALNINHPDIEEFIGFKSTLNSRNERLMKEYDRNLHTVNGMLNGTKYAKILEKTLLDDQLTHFNISVMLTDKFMQAVEDDKDWDLISPYNNQVVKTVKAKDLLMKMANQAWESGDPGELFYDRINEDNLVPYIGNIEATNPCVTGDTKILTVENGPQTFKSLAESGKDVLVYAWNQSTKLPVVRWMRNPRLTRKNAELVEVVLDSGLKIKCTPDHNFYTFRGEKIKAIDLKPDQSIRAFSMSEHRVISVTPIDEKEDVYNGTVDDVHTYIIVDDNPIAGIYSGIVSANCGEVPLLSGESCILTSINLHEMYDKKNKDVNWDLLKDVTKTAIRFLDNVTEITEAPLPFIDEITKGLRRLGLGVLGWSDLLVELNIPYDSLKALELAEKLSWFINFHAWETSFELAKERGAFPLFNKDLVNWYVVNKVLYEGYETSNIDPEILCETGVRNVACGSIAPTGSIAIIGGVNSSIEPFFALAYRRNITEGVGNIASDSIYETNPALQRKLKEFEYNDEETKRKILEYASTNGTLTGCDLVSDEFQSIFKTANEISWQNHIDMQAAWQKYFSNAISKTINIPEEATVQDIYNIYVYMWKKGLKGGTVYRNNSKSFQILEKPAKKD